MNEIHKRSLNSKNDDDYDQESGEYKKNFNNQQSNNKSHKNIVRFIIGFAVSILIFGCYIDIFSNKNIVNNVNHSIVNQNTRRLKSYWKEECERNQTKIRILRLIQEVATRWHSLFLCLNRIKQLHKYVKEVIN